MTNQSTPRRSLSDRFDSIKLPFNRFFLFLAMVIMTAIVMGLIGFRLYQLSDAASLDLSRPQYQAIWKEAKQDVKSDPRIEITGEIDASFKQEVLSGLEHYHSQIGDGRPFSDLPLLDENLISTASVAD